MSAANWDAYAEVATVARACGVGVGVSRPALDVIAWGNYADCRRMLAVLGWSAGERLGEHQQTYHAPTGDRTARIGRDPESGRASVTFWFYAAVRA